VLSGDCEVHLPTGDDVAQPVLAATALADYVQESDAVGAMTLSLQHRGEPVGALLLDFDAPPTPETVEFAQVLALALAAALDMHRAAARTLGSHLRDSAGEAMGAVFGPTRPGLKLLSATLGLLLLLSAVWPVAYRISAPATVEGRVQRAAVAPFAGFIQEASVRAGDRVKAGDVMARLDDRDLRLEEARWSAQAELAERKVREALARGTAAAMQLARAEGDEAVAQLALVRARLARAAVAAPFDGVVVRGDLSQQLGAPVEQGKVLFEVAPLDAWRVVLQVDERDVLDVRAGAEGELVLSSVPGEKHRIRVAKVAPVATAEEGRNSFRVEADVQGAAARIQPGMEGVGKVVAGEHSLLWIAFHRFGDWLRYTAWSVGL
jgi:RND family efflux transporter MFP subunit